MLSYAHPIAAALALLFAFVVFRDGLSQRKQRLRRTPAPEGSRARHVKWGPLAVVLIIAASLEGVVSAIVLREMEPLRSTHGWLGLACAALFALTWWLGRRLVKGAPGEAGRHGVIGVLLMFLAAIVALLGIPMLP
ncbi:MAG: DUF4079 family protein [Myxococcaceae bacterium]